MRSVQSNNPVFQRSETLARATQSGVGFRTPTPTAEDVAAIYGTPQRMTLDDVIVKTGLLLAVVVGFGAASWFFGVSLGTAALAGIVGFVLAMVNIFKKQVSVPLVLAYGAAQGVFLGAISASYEGQYQGIVVQAVVGTAAVFGAVLLGYKSGRLRATPKFQKVVTARPAGHGRPRRLNMLSACSATATPSGSAARTSACRSWSASGSSSSAP
jgi:uncharacterized YccA/Bax inhibitor family protein